MLTRNLGRSGLRVSLVGLGCNNFGGRIDDVAARKVVDAAIEHGITLFDTADVYGARGGPRRYSASFWARGARISCSPASSAWI